MLPIADENAGRRIFPFITYALILINAIVFLIELISGDEFIIRWSFVPARFLDNPGGDFITLITSMFMHAGWLHLLGNMLYLFIFGDNVEDAWGHLPFLVFYLLCGIAATFAQLAFSTGSNIPQLGASGAIAGVLGAYLVMFPRSRVTVLMGYFVVPLPALVVIGFWFVLQLFSGIAAITAVPTGAEEGGVAYMAHVGGFVAGLIVAFIFRPRNRPAARLG
jgi:membrane associated rhomboid family serine protease